MVWQGGTADRKTTVTPETVGLLVEKCGAAFRSRYVVCLQARGDIRWLTCVFSSFFLSHNATVVQLSHLAHSTTCGLYSHASHLLFSRLVPSLWPLEEGQFTLPHARSFFTPSPHVQDACAGTHCRLTQHILSLGRSLQPQPTAHLTYTHTQTHTTAILSRVLVV